MVTNSFTLELEAKKPVAVIDITPSLRQMVKKSKIREGILTVFTQHTTTGIRINEKEDRLMIDLEMFLERLSPRSAKYLHDDVELRDCPPNERINGHSHLKAMVLNSSETIPIENGALCLGKWQSVLFLELDGRRKRNIKVKIIGS